MRADSIAENTNFIDKAYADLLQRSPSLPEVASGLTSLGGQTRFQFALSLDTSSEYYRLLANSYFQDLLGRSPNLKRFWPPARNFIPTLQFLQRPANSAELNSFAADLHGGKMTDEQVIAWLDRHP